LYGFGLPPDFRSKPGRNRKQKFLLPIETKRTTCGQSNLIGTRIEERLIVTKKSPTMDEECDCNLLNY
jgi:hypothetical protein